MRCPVCNGSGFLSGSEVFDDRYGEPNRYHLALCPDCGHTATAPRLSEPELPLLYETFYPRKALTAAAVTSAAAQVNRPFGSLSRWWNGTDNQGQYGVRPGETVLDVGCGSGVSLLEARALGGVAYGIEADPNVKPVAEALALRIHFGRIDERPFADLLFDLIVMNQVIEHLPDPDISLTQLRDRLKPTGRMVLVFPNTASFWRRLSGSRWINWHVPYHLHHFDRKNFERMVVRCGLRVANARTVTPNVWTLLQLRALRHRPQPGRPSSLWIVSAPPSKGLRAGRYPGWLRCLALGALALLNRVIDATGHGDSLMVELRGSNP